MEGNGYFTPPQETIELACVVREICQRSKIKPPNLRILPAIDHLLCTTEKVRFKKRIPLKIPIPPQLAPLGSESCLLVSRERCIDKLYADYHGEDSSIGKLEHGLGEFVLIHPTRNIRFWVWRGSLDYYLIGTNNAYFLHKKDVYLFTSFFKQLKAQGHPEIEPPILPSKMLDEIYRNSIGFLLKGQTGREQYQKHRIPYKRGILLSGRPGCGKTLTCKWLRALCEMYGFAYRIVTMENYREAMSRGRVRGLFKLPGKKNGLIFFDDMDIMVEDRRKGAAHTLSTFLSELDGLEEVEGVVYVFTTNYMKELDEAFVRPGRIDLWLPFNIPTVKLRKKFVEHRFDKEILSQVDAEEIITRSEEYSFAELEEIRKLFCMDLIDNKELDIEETFGIFDKHRKDFEARAQITGFSTLTDDDEDYDDEGFPAEPVFVPHSHPHPRYC